MASNIQKTEIASIPVGWDIKRFKDIAEIIMGQSPKGINVNSNKDGMPLLNGPTEFGINNPIPVQYTTAPCKIAKKGNLLFCVRGSTTGRMNWGDQDYAIGRGLASISSKDGNDYERFTKAVLEYSLPRLLSDTTGSTFPNLSKSQIENLDVFCPPKEERRKIAEIFSSLDGKIELNRQINANMEKLASALFKHWFIDFEFPDENGKPYKSSGGKMIDSELEEIPTAWKIGTLGEVAANQRRGIKPEDMNSSMPYIALEHMPRGSIALTAWDYAQDLGSNKSLFKRGDILFGKLRPYFHKVGIAPLNGVCSTDILVITPKAQGWYGYVLSHVASIDFVNYTSAGSTGTKMPRTNWNDMSSYEVVLPPLSVAEQFTELTRPLFERIISNVTESRKLAALRDSLLPRLMSGKIRVM